MEPGLVHAEQHQAQGLVHIHPGILGLEGAKELPDPPGFVHVALLQVQGLGLHRPGGLGLGGAEGLQEYFVELCFLHSDWPQVQVLQYPPVVPGDASDHRLLQCLSVETLNLLYPQKLCPSALGLRGWVKASNWVSW